MEVLWSPEVFEPAEVPREAADSAWVLLPAQHGLVSWKGVICEDLAGALDLGPVYWTFL